MTRATAAGMASKTLPGPVPAVKIFRFRDIECDDDMSPLGHRPTEQRTLPLKRLGRTEAEMAGRFFKRLEER